MILASWRYLYGTSYLFVRIALLGEVAAVLGRRVHFAKFSLGGHSFEWSISSLINAGHGRSSF
jgi:hypothetical protein